MIPHTSFLAPREHLLPLSLLGLVIFFSRSRHPIILPPSFISLCILILHHSASNPFASSVISCDPLSDPLPFNFVDTRHRHVTYTVVVTLYVIYTRRLAAFPQSALG